MDPSDLKLSRYVAEPGRPSAGGCRRCGCVWHPRGWDVLREHSMAEQACRQRPETKQPLGHQKLVCPHFRTNCNRTVKLEQSKRTSLRPHHERISLQWKEWHRPFSRWQHCSSTPTTCTHEGKGSWHSLAQAQNYFLQLISARDGPAMI